MLKRTKGYVLLALLVVTGLASQVSSPTLKGKERRYLTEHLKDTRADLLASVKDLSPAQLNFKPAPGQWSIKECLQHIAGAEEGIWKNATAALQQPVADSEVANRLSEENINVFINEIATNDFEGFEPGAAKWKTATNALEHFKEQRKNAIKYVKTTTENVRSHVAQTPVGALDVYSALLAMSAHTAKHTRQIEAIKAHPAFPK